MANENTPRRWLLWLGLAFAGVVALVLAGLYLTRGPVSFLDPDRAEMINGCEVAWKLEVLDERAPAQAMEVAAVALRDAEPDPDSLHLWEETLSNSDDSVKPPTGERLEALAYAEAVRAEVRDALDAAGYPDNQRVVETYTDVHCED
ncbi:hypothetical protein [uncultured Microbacterium sp.]|uniref:hypothetical protein n=1 Tax=uncultured Microbacterium sp. TaxID=191216 RepID=UPI002627FE9E|nr:hypothetical protein [uncultured Microbacterium sp.]